MLWRGVLTMSIWVELLGSPVGLSGRELGDRLVELDRVRRALEAATVAVLDEAERSDAYRDDGCIALGSWARCQVLWSKHEATTRLRELDLVRLCPEVAVGVGVGSVGYRPGGGVGAGAGEPAVR